MAWLDRMGGVSRIDFSGGEPFLCKGFVSACCDITRKHFIGINTNFVLPPVLEFARRVDPSRVIFVNASIHFDQLKKHNLIGKYIEHYHLYKSKGFNIVASMVAYPGISNHIQEYREYFNQYGISFNCTHFFGWYRNLHYPGAYSKEDYELYQLDKSFLKKPPRLCNAGYNSCVVYPNGYIFTCYLIPHKIGFLYSNINWRNTLLNCKIKECSCPAYFRQKELFDVAVERTKQRSCPI
jgi:MoaA/NifB/PqqE/SkfB family radical SAM enzyme